ncbi:hypothetical protein V5O48_015618 [Marasmius crinis-equi]|uniref:D-xylose 1-dehydrogenase (NADP(+), D-xylono-1,5-lactone-forming) n=1 Tax=Marasmius crinis-equi TaxID=585013 RepID=A0ABR3EU09_9AGAR
MTSIFSAVKRVYTAYNPPRPKAESAADSKPVKWGVLGAAKIAPAGLIIPARNHTEVEVYAVAARDITKANAFAKKHGIPKAYEGYQKLLDDPEIEVVYNPLPVGLHFEWTMKALAAGKHVLLEKPSANTAEETRQMFEYAESKGLILLEAFHYRFHPAVHRLKMIVDSGELGPIRNITVTNSAPLNWAEDDIRYNYDLGGGGMMDMGCYTISCMRYLVGADPTEVLSSTYELHKSKSSSSESRVDRKTEATFAFPNDVTGRIEADLSMPYRFKVIPPWPKTSAIVDCESGSIEMLNYILPTLYHSITVVKRDAKNRTTRTEKVYKPSDAGWDWKGEDWWLTYTYQLEAFMDKLKGRTPKTWIEKEDSVADIHWIEKVYEKALNPPKPAADSKPVKWGILGAAQIAPLALIIPAKSHSEVEVLAVAARDINKANVFAKKHGIPKAYEGYQKLLDDPEIEVVYNPLPNGLHFEWTMKALAAGKHVLLEKPSSNTAEETRQMFEFAESKGLILLEAFHYRFHPAIQRTKAIVDSGELGPIRNIKVTNMWPLKWAEDDIRYSYDLGGGALMDMGCYTISCMRYLVGSNPTEVLSSTSGLHKPKTSSSEGKVDGKTEATFAFPNDVTGTIGTELSMPYRFKIIPPVPRVSALVECESGSVEIYNYVIPTFYHSITIVSRGGEKKTTRTEKVYKPSDAGWDWKGEDWWFTYRYQLEAFMDKLKGRTPQTWVEKEDSITNMEWIEKVYEKNGLGPRPKSTYVHAT